ncbi:MAG: Hpt domain-containing protein [Dokdonella sp.]
MNETDPHYDPLRMRYAASLARKHADLVQAWRAFADTPDAAARLDLHAQIHRLSGSASSYGYVRLGAVANAADELMSQPEPQGQGSPQMSTAAIERLAASIQTLLGALADAEVLAKTEPPAIP